MKTKTYEIINPSDAVTLQASDLRIAGVAVLLLGNGLYGLTDENDEAVVPLMLFGTSEKWLKENHIESLNDFIKENKSAIADVLASVTYGKIEERLGFDKAVGMMTPEKAKEYRAWWNDKNRSSLNDIGQRALAIAAKLRGNKDAMVPRVGIIVAVS